MKPPTNPHTWKLNSNGEIDYFAYIDDWDFHNGPECEVCEFVFCEHCDRSKSGLVLVDECPGAWDEES